MSLIQLENYAEGKWIPSSENGEILKNAITGEPLYYAESSALDFDSMMKFARSKGASKLRKMSFQERGLMLKKLALHLLTKKELFYKVSAYTGATKSDSWVDIEGGIGNLFAYASLRRQFGNEWYYVEGETAKLSKQNTFIGHHILVPKEGVAIHINAFNFPVWGMLEKIAVNLLAGVPAIVKPATLTSYLTEVVFKEIIASNIVPEGALQLICGSARGILDYCLHQDVVTFTGSAETGKKLKITSNIIENSIPFNMEADSLNACVLGTDITPDMPEFDIFIKEVVREMTTKAGQKCTAIRRILVPENRTEDVIIALGKRLQSNTIGDPSVEGVRMGPLAGLSQRDDVLEKVNQLKASQQVVIGGNEDYDVKGADKIKGAFMSPIVFLNETPYQNTACHDVEAFGPVSTIIPYKEINDAVQLIKMGKGSLVSSIVTANNDIAKEFTLEAASSLGRILVLNSACAKESTGHGSPMPLLVHGGPGRAGGGEEMGGKRGVFHYMQRTAIQGSPDMLTAITNQYQQGATGIHSKTHPFKKTFHELKIGDQIVTEKRLITSEDINRFADLSGDHFYAHNEDTHFEGTMFTHQVAHGYFIMSVAAGLFVDSYEMNPVLLNYGIDELRFTKPVYPDTSVYVRFTCKEKIDQEKRNDEDIDKGIVKWLVEILDESEEPLVGIATILTMVKK
ncbi:MAG: phenylacetic acid degradation bifunctional protein PaaZ [Chitinophagaceae bacterium]|nr:MAG: phenylacetic acid degradation protein paaN [Bacteroidetes bacterium OLB11]MCC6448834.1 phenylacetic acid degradation bifunctional protein PaaZ [Chitinophagaceae bacterium]HMN32590.1 phenylacetic acid degradation bifunctional protein PaaZ [Chitinophagaceae bacterium]